MVWSNGKYIKDLTYLNRDPKNIIIIDRDIENVGKHKQNAIVLKQFTGDDNDTQLIKLLPLLESNFSFYYLELAEPSVKDVRKIFALFQPQLSHLTKSTFFVQLYNT